MLHNEYGSIAIDWGVIEPESGNIISGVSHETADGHPKLKVALENEKSSKIVDNLFNYADYVFYRQKDVGLTLMLRSFNKHAHKALILSLNNLPIAERYEHDSKGKFRGTYWKFFSDKKSLYNYLKTLI